MANLGKFRAIWPVAAILLIGAAVFGWYLTAAPEPALADADAGVPVYLNGPYVEDGLWRGNSETYERIAYAEVVAGHTYVPLRAVFEACEAEVSWDGAAGRITAETLGGDSITMHVGSTLAKINEQEVELAAVPYAREGRVMVPLRFVGESLGCGVDWRSGGVGPGFGRNAAADAGDGEVVYLTRNITATHVGQHGETWYVSRRAGGAMEYFVGNQAYRLYCGDGRVVSIDEDGETELGRLDLSVLGDSEFGHWTGFEVRETPRGNWQVSFETIFAWLAPELDRAYSTNCTDPSPYNRQEPLWISGADGRGEILLPGDGEVLIIDDGSGELVQRLEGSILRWADAGHVLFGVGDKWELIDRRTEERRDLSREILSAENKARLEAQLADFDEAERERFWGDLSHVHTDYRNAFLQFTGAEKDVLRFSLTSVNLPPDDTYARLEIKIEI